jgi:hypothetical protein
MLFDHDADRRQRPSAPEFRCRVVPHGHVSSAACSPRREQVHENLVTTQLEEPRFLARMDSREHQIGKSRSSPKTQSRGRRRLEVRVVGSHGFLSYRSLTKPMSCISTSTPTDRREKVYLGVGSDLHEIGVRHDLAIHSDSGPKFGVTLCGQFKP